MQGRFFAALALVSMATFVLVGMIALPLWVDAGDPTRTATFRGGSVMFCAAFGAYALNRSGRNSVAVWLFGVATIVTLSYAATDAPLLMVFLTLTMLTTGALLPLLHAFAMGLGAMVSLILVTLFAPARDHIVLAFLLNATFLPLMLVVKWHNERLARLRTAELLRRERLFATTLSSIGDGVLTTDIEGRVTFMNPIAEALTGYGMAGATGRRVDEVFHIVNEHSGARMENPVTKILALPQVVGVTNHLVLVARDGTRRQIADNGAPILADGVMFGVVLVFRDVSSERALRAQLEHSQRLDALGKLAGGVAHDFNNLLMAISAGTQLALDGLSDGHRARTELGVVLEATGRAVGVTRQLLAFGRRQPMHREPVQLNTAVQGALRLFQRLLKQDVQVESELAQDAGCILVDPVQFEQVLLNLAVNANDAMPDGGTLRISTARVRSSEQQVDPPLPTGDYGLLRVRDTGVGMDGATLARIFEPFFTTKEQGRGTGLGLATVYGIVEQSEGTIRVSSQPGAGTTFDIYLPAIEAPMESSQPPGKHTGSPPHTRSAYPPRGGGRPCASDPRLLAKSTPEL